MTPETQPLSTIPKEITDKYLAELRDGFGEVGDTYRTTALEAAYDMAAYLLSMQDIVAPETVARYRDQTDGRLTNLYAIALARRERQTDGMRTNGITSRQSSLMKFLSRAA